MCVAANWLPLWPAIVFLLGWKTVFQPAQVIATLQIQSRRSDVKKAATGGRPVSRYLGVIVIVHVHLG